MAKFKDSSATADTSTVVTEEGPNVADRSIGSIIAETRHLTAEQVEKVLRHQREKGIRFGEAAIALGYASSDDVLFALSQHFHYLRPRRPAQGQPRAGGTEPAVRRAG